MKKIIFSFIVLAVAVPAFASAAANVSLTPSTFNVKAGQTVAVQVSVNPAGENVYTSKVVLSYSKDLLKATAFNFAPVWLPLSQPGYDSMDSGLVIKTAGYPGGVSTSKVFGTVTFTALKSGTASIGVMSDTQIYNAQNKNVFSGNGGAPVQVTISNATVSGNNSVAGGTNSTVQGASTTATPVVVKDVAAEGGSATKNYTSYILGALVLLALGAAARLIFGKTTK
ncbi:MAG: cohesin domain-containing protein [Candidatus Pacebacteria bacterium]|nr:cohesin domain-containing protein [Candidatus Paceibacterota bacterium]MDD5357071.1 cohesin domain-containing protein [Candidatus Paceibacterota bacterium]